MYKTIYFYVYFTRLTGQWKKCKEELEKVEEDNKRLAIKFVFLTFPQFSDSLLLDSAFSKQIYFICKPSVFLKHLLCKALPPFYYFCHYSSFRYRLKELLQEEKVRKEMVEKRCEKLDVENACLLAEKCFEVTGIFLGTLNYHYCL